MKLTKITVSNYRNLNDITITLNTDCNYIIGENNLGKSNLLSLLTAVFGGKSIDDKDYLDPDKPVDITLEIKLLPNEIGFFGDNFSPDDSSLIRIRYFKLIGEAYPTVVSADTNEAIQIKHLRKMNFMKYETTAVPGKELRIDGQRGAGLLVCGIIERFVNNSEPNLEFLEQEQVSSLIEYINNRLNKIKAFREHSISATFSTNPTEMLSSMLYLSDGERKIDTTGSGVQYLAMASINTLCQIMELYKSKSNPFSDLLYTNDEGEKILPLVLAIDEPEVHLNPYLQRSLIGYYRKILSNGDDEFTELLRLCFGIDGIDGQLIVVTHSTDVLVGDYRNIVRFYRRDDKINAVSGADITLTDSIEKHLLMSFKEVKEAFYSKCVIFVEGATEYGCIHNFAEKLGVSLDDCGICVISANGEKSIKQLRTLLSKFAIPSIAVYDGDVGNREVNDIDFYTVEVCFEVEIVKTLYTNNEIALVKTIVEEIDNNADVTILDEDFVRKPFKKMEMDLNLYAPKRLSDVDEADEVGFCSMYAAWLFVKKGIILGRIVGDIIPVNLIPQCYKDAIIKAKDVAASG